MQNNVPCLQLQFDMIINYMYSKFHVDILKLFEKWAKLKFLHNNKNINNTDKNIDKYLVFTTAQLFLGNRHVKI